jgi:hypothetical protein
MADEVHRGVPWRKAMTELAGIVLILIRGITAGDNQLKGRQSGLITQLLTREAQRNRPKPVDFCVEIVCYYQVNDAQSDGSNDLRAESMCVLRYRKHIT